MLGGAPDALRFCLDRPVPAGLVAADFLAERAGGAMTIAGQSIVVVGVASFEVVFPFPLAPPPPPAYGGWQYNGAALATASGDYLAALSPWPLVLAVVNRGGNNVAVIFDREVTASSGIDTYFLDSTAMGDPITWVGGVWAVQLGSFASGGAAGNDWEWTPGGGSGLVSPDTGVVQSGLIE